MSDIPVVYYNQVSSEKQEIKSKWWLSDKQAAHAHIFGVIKNIKRYQNHRSLNYLRYARLYSNLELTSLTGGLFAKSNDAQNYLANRVTYNVIKSCIDTAAAKIAKAKPRPIFLTEEGSYTLKQKAKKLSAFMEGQFDEMGTGTGEDRTFYGLGRQCFVDACLFGTGAVKLFFDGEKIKAERVFIDEILVDETEGRYRQPRQIHQVKLVHRDVLIDMFPKFEAAIKACPSGLGAEHETTADMVEVAESWHLQTSAKSGDGKHGISIENCTLFFEDYKKDYFPFLFQRWSMQPLGFYGRGLAEELIGIQLEINKLLRSIQLAQHLCAVPQVWLDVQSKAIAKHIDNHIGGIKYFTGQPPIFMTPTAMNAEVYNHLERLYQRAFEISGLSQLSATSQKPAGLDSGVALREYQDIETERFSLTSQMYEDFYVESSYLVMDMLRDLKERGINVEIKVRDGNFFNRLTFKDVDIPDDHSSIRSFPTNFLPSTPAGKLQSVQEMVAAGFFSQEEALELLDFPDISKAKSIKLAPREAVYKTIEHIIDKGEYLPPEPFMDLDFAAKTSQNYYLRGRADGMPEDRLDLLRAFMEDCDALLNPEQPPAPSMPVDAASMSMDPGLPPDMGMIDPSMMAVGAPSMTAAAPMPTEPMPIGVPV